MVKIKLLKSEQDGYHKQMLMNHSNDSFIYTYSFHHDVVDIQIESFQSLKDAFHDIAFLSEWHIKRSHPKKILIHCDPKLKLPLTQNGYYSKGKDYQKIIDPLRNQLYDPIFDEEGYIIDQGSMSSVSFGWFDTAKKGCGWIAVYNLLKMNGIYKDINTVISDLEKHNFLGKVFGQEIVWLIVYLKQQGLDVFVSLPGITACQKALKCSSSGILAYSHSRGAHYAAYSNIDDDHVHFYNAVYRKKNHIVQLSTFLKENTILHGCIVIGVRKKAEI